jgi:hypothetical protein
MLQPTIPARSHDVARAVKPLSVGLADSALAAVLTVMVAAISTAGSDDSLYQALGQKQGINEIVNDMYDTMLADLRISATALSWKNSDG